MDPDTDGDTAGAHDEKTPLDAPLDEFLDAKAKTYDPKTGARSGAYATQLNRTLQKWIDWLDDRGVEYLEDLDSQTVGRWAQYLSRRVASHNADADSGLSRASAWTYYNHVSAYLTYCREWEFIAENPAQAAVVENAMPDRPSGGSKNQQFWSPTQRQTLLQYVDERAHNAIDERGSDAVTEVRDRALCYLLGYSGVRGAEVLSHPDTDWDGRNGAPWDALDLESATISIYGKSQEWEQAPLTDKPRPALERWHDILDPSTGEWPLFPTSHRPSLWSSLREQLEERGHNNTDELLDPYDDVMDAYRAYDCVPPALTTAGGRQLLKRLSESAGVDTSDDSKNYLTLHGARRGAGEMYYRKEGASAAQRALRHADPSTTSEMYSHIEASELSEIGSRVFDDE
ncbi:Site-specific recombinase XerD [Natronoarchaeum philippinense]|uniref:Site-specific recombinase XerD n=1 Tax=Natronoarchaeum philippinense TaxID=558529 RepID=A0A285P5U6_NATPI|nr:tyrosine-type recombinase/integrase [Natronoarchaeum philippinense]SNZ17100.1 Site-specific recombinase XerD [Natronoarchaeum philippinense]